MESSRGQQGLDHFDGPAEEEAEEEEDEENSERAGGKWRMIQ